VSEPAASTADRGQQRSSEPHCPVCGGGLSAPLFDGRDRFHGQPGTMSIARCETCGLGVTLPVVEASQLASLYPASYATYDAPPEGMLGLLSKAVQRVLAWQALHTAPLRLLATTPAGLLLDVGCGRGDLGSWFVRRGWSVVGVEPSERACAVARSRGTDARVGTLAEVELEPHAYDVVVFRHSLEHFADPVADLRHARNALRDGGVMIVTVPNFDCWQRRRFRGCWFHLELPRHRVHFGPRSLREALLQAGFERVETVVGSSSVGLPASIQYAIAGRCLFASPWSLRIAVAACGLTAPLAWMLTRFTTGGEVLHAVAPVP
jgi:SAM-dependent methyltransferase